MTKREQILSIVWLEEESHYDSEWNAQQVNDA